MLLSGYVVTASNRRTFSPRLSHVWLIDIHGTMICPGSMRHRAIPLASESIRFERTARL